MSIKYVRLTDSRGRVGRTLHIVRTPPSDLWRGQTWCGRRGEPVALPAPPMGRGRVCPACREAYMTGTCKRPDQVASQWAKRLAPASPP